MNIFNRLFNREKRASLDTEIVPEVDAPLLRALVGTTEITPETAMEIPAFSAAVDFIANTAAMLPVKLYHEIPGQRKTEEITDDRRLFLLNDEANSTMNAYDAKRAQIRDMLINGAGYLYINGGESLHYVKHCDISVTSNSDPIFRDFDIFVGGRRYYPFDFVILTRGSSDGVTGIGAVKEHKTLLSAMFNTMKYENMISRTGGNKKGFLQAEHKLSKEAFETMKRAWEELYANNGNNMMLLNDGVKYVPSASTSVEMQLNENKQTNSEQIASIFELSPEIINGMADTQQYISAVRTAVIPVVVAYQAALNKSLLRESEKGRYYFALDTTELLKGDTLSRYQAYAIGLKNGFMQIDEVRYLEDKEPLGFNYIKLGLQDVLLDPKTGAVYTPNTNQTALVGREPPARELTAAAECGIMESEETRVNWTKGEHGYFTGSKPGGGKGHDSSGKSSKTPVMHKGGGTASGSAENSGSGKNSAKKDLTNENKGDIMVSDRECFIHDDKINKFCLLPGAKHSMDFFEVGYTINDGEQLKRDITVNFDYKNAVDIVQLQNKEKFSIFMELGVNKKRRFRTVWEKTGENPVPRFITAHRE